MNVFVCISPLLLSSSREWIRVTIEDDGVLTNDVNASLRCVRSTPSLSENGRKNAVKAADDHRLTVGFPAVSSEHLVLRDARFLLPLVQIYSHEVLHFAVPVEVVDQMNLVFI
ncbi:hypothetical protein NPIL_272171 [Nephila pilipes]|uniref:Uncharacterized protein n=1 Tax=Nephila pilipes TaxID=299642 RepID=A0A8X6TV12_NEPPI|nr:hypothetical protein NPIL_272171 [Nephila pilipes]